MEYIKIIQDYSKNAAEEQMASYLANKLDSSICCEEIKNVNFKVKYLKPLNNFVIYSTAVCCEDKKEIT